MESGLFKYCRLIGWAIGTPNGSDWLRPKNSALSTFFFLTGSGLGTGQAQVGHNSDQAKTVTSTCEKETFSSFQMPQTLCREEDKKQKGRLNDL